jgi:hypothetical protein
MVQKEEKGRKAQQEVTVIFPAEIRRRLYHCLALAKAQGTRHKTQGTGHKAQGTDVFSPQWDRTVVASGFLFAQRLHGPQLWTKVWLTCFIDLSGLVFFS